MKRITQHAQISHFLSFFFCGNMLQLYYISLNAQRENKKKHTHTQNKTETFRDIEKQDTENETAAAAELGELEPGTDVMGQQSAELEPNARPLLQDVRQILQTPRVERDGRERNRRGGRCALLESVACLAAGT